ncbi:olfactory receptor 1019-like [Bombina bombina]|uniref:olfactory receptor 1019-like n=1 Tax=Bombina bombina TaxID=8345 RepID=UPI00235A9495|nr:olfactory receptor 1019-like [Bombina bombina]
MDDFNEESKILTNKFLEKGYSVDLLENSKNKDFQLNDLSSSSWAAVLDVLLKSNKSATEFLIVGFSDAPDLQIPLFSLFFLIYSLTVLGNLIIILLISSDINLQKPMYFFLCSMSCLDISYSSVTAPNLLHMFITANKMTSFNRCMVQLYFFNSFASMEYLLLTTMAYDRYMAICNPLIYPQIMNKKNCLILVAMAWLSGFLAGLPVTVLSSALAFCTSNIINHFFCDVTPLLKLACGDTSTIKFVMFAQGVCLLFSCFLLTVMSYIYIINAILKISSAEGRLKTFSTCGSHLTVVVLFYVLVVGVYMKPTSSYSLDEGKFLSVLYVNVIPMLNPIIYTLRNKDVKESFRKACRNSMATFHILGSTIHFKPSTKSTKSKLTSLH